MKFLDWSTCLPLIVVLLLLRTPQVTSVIVTGIRLMNGTSLSIRVGRVEIQVNNANTWGSICTNGWDYKDAVVACRMLGFINGGEAVNDTRFGTGSLNFLMENSACTGDETSLSQCLAGQGSDCSPTIDKEAGVICNGTQTPGQSTGVPASTTTAAPSVISGNCQQTSPTVRLIGKQGIDGMGFVEVQQPNGTWGFVCDDDWSMIAAAIVCAQLCFPTNYSAKPGIPAENVQKPVNPVVVLDNVKCFGNESTLQNCSHSPWGTQDCLANGGELAGVQCVAAPYLPPPAPVPVLVCGEGKMAALFLRAQDPNLNVTHLSVFSQPNCADADKAISNEYVSITIPVDKCGTITTRNGTHIIYFNQILYDSTSQQGGTTTANIYRIEIRCILPVDLDVTQRVQPMTEAVTQSAIGTFKANLTIYRNDSFTIVANENPVRIPLGEYLNMVVSMEEFDPNLKLVVKDCVASPTGDILQGVRKVLFADKCSQEETLSFYPLSNFRFGFRFKPFKFVGFDILYIYCSGVVCLTSDNTQECDRTCANNKPNNTTPAAATTTAAAVGRRKRSNADIYSVSVMSQAIVIYDPYFAVIGAPQMERPDTRTLDKQDMTQNPTSLLPVVTVTAQIRTSTFQRPVVTITSMAQTSMSRLSQVTETALAQTQQSTPNTSQLLRDQSTLWIQRYDWTTLKSNYSNSTSVGAQSIALVADTDQSERLKMSLGTLLTGLLLLIILHINY